LQIDEVYSSPLERAVENAQTIVDLQALAGFSGPPVKIMDSLNNRDWGGLEGRLAAEVHMTVCRCLLNLICAD
jgi:broad specificity phosphatase PhoE